MAIQVKIDENMPASVASRLAEMGYDATTVLAQNMGGWKDPKLWQAVQEEGRFLVTADKGFGDVRTYPPGSHNGVLLLRPDEDGIRPLIDLVNLVLAEYPLESLRGLLTVATPRGIRIRR